jgi:uncharacterized protein (TIGR02284 family)
MAERTERALLNHLIEMCRDGQRGFAAAAEQVQTPELRTLFVQLADQRRRFADALLPHAQRLGGESDETGTSAAALHRAWMQVKGRLARDRDAAILAEAVRGERFALAAYDDAVHDMLPPDARVLIEAQDEALHTAIGQIQSAGHE